MSMCHRSGDAPRATGWAVRHHTHKNAKIVFLDAMVNFDILPNLHSIVTLLSGLSDFLE